MATDYAAMLREGYAAVTSVLDDEISRLEYLSDWVFGFTTYETEYSELFARKALEVCQAISAQETFVYIEQSENRLWYLMLLNTPFFATKIDWGTSVRGAWWSGPAPRYTIKLSCNGLWLDGRQVCEPLEFTRDQWRRFIAAVVAFGAEKPTFS